MNIALDFALVSWGFAACGTLLAMAAQQDWHSLPGIIKGASELALGAAAAFAKPPAIFRPAASGDQVVHDALASIMAQPGVDTSAWLNKDRAQAALDARQ